MDSTEDGDVFIKHLAQFVRSHEVALANALQLQRRAPRQSHDAPPSSTSRTIAAALSLPSYLSFSSPRHLKPVKLTLTPHHLFYLLSRFDELGVPVGPMNVRLENIHTDASPSEYVSFLGQAHRSKRHARGSDQESISSVSSLRSVMSSMSSFWASFGLSSKSAAQREKHKLAIKDDLRYLYSAFTKIPCLRLGPDHRARLITDYEEFPFDTAVPLFAFKNLSALEIHDVDFRQFYGWDRMADQLRSLTVKRASLDDPADLLYNIVIDDLDKRRRKAAKAPGSPTAPMSTSSPRHKHAELARYSPEADSPPRTNRRVSSDGGKMLSESRDTRDVSPSRQHQALPRRPKSTSPTRIPSPRPAHRPRASMSQLRRTSASSNSSVHSTTPRGSTSNLLSLGILPPSKWRFLRHLSIADNSLTTLSAASLSPVANTLQSLDLSSNLFAEIPDSLASLTALRALNLSNCMIESLHSLLRNPLPAVTTLNLRHNRLLSLAGIERLLSLERVDFRDNKLTDPTEMARLTAIPNMREIYVNKNPFSKTHSGYRITIFNLFRNTAGYTEDVVLDASPPSYSERKQLIDRVPEPVNVPIIKPPYQEEPELQPITPPSDSPARSMAAESRRQRPQPQHASTDYAVASHRRRRAGKRRIVEFSKQDDSFASPPPPPPPQDMAFAGDGPSTPPPSQPPASSAPTTVTTETQVQTHTSPRQQPKASEPAPPLKPFSLPPIPPPVESNIPDYNTHPSKRTLSDFPLGSSSGGGDAYRKRIEQLKDELGPNWLSALSDERWDSPPVAGGAGGLPASVVMPAVPVRTQSQGMVSTGRTLG